MSTVSDWLQLILAIPVLLALPFFFALIIKSFHWLSDLLCRATIWYLTAYLRAMEWSGKEPEE